MAKKLWGGRFTKKTDPLVEEFTRSIQYDYKLAEYDLVGSMVHVEILKKAGYLKPGEASALSKALQVIYKDVTGGKFKPVASSEDIHTDIQNKVSAKVGALSLKLHTARSRNDQVAFATKLYSKVSILKLQIEIANLIAALGRLASKNKDLIMPGFTHMQHAQPVALKAYLGAYVEMLKRDNKRLNLIFKNIKLTMGAGALAGTPIDANKYTVDVAKYLEGVKYAAEDFKAVPAVNSLDSVSDRDFAVEIISALSIIAMHLSRLSEDFIIWSTKEFDFIEIDESFCTGSSLMPNKKNADVLELARGYAGRIYGNLVSILTTMKGLPLAYNRDMQLDKEPLFSSIEITTSELAVSAGLIDGIKFNKAKIEEELEDESLYATDLVYYLVGKGTPFTDAHTVVGKLVKHCIESSIDIKSMSNAELKKFSNKFEIKEVIRLFNPKVSVNSKKSIKN